MWSPGFGPHPGSRGLYSHIKMSYSGLKNYARGQDEVTLFPKSMATWLHIDDHKIALKVNV